MSAWFEKSYARLLIDNHISEDAPELMTRFDPTEYVRMVKLGNIDAAMVYATCHNGNCYYPTKVGHMHANLRGRDIFGETVRGLQAAGVTPVAYYTTVYHNQAAQDHPSWRMTDFAGNQHQGRYWHACPNNADFVAFTKEQIAEVIAYPVVGVFIDMVFWPHVCCCHNCRRRYRAETGGEIPAAVDWRDPSWVRFQRARERWMADFTGELTADVRARRPECSVTYQCSLMLAGWFFGQDSRLYSVADYTSADFYGGKHQQRFGTKVMAAYSQRLPYEFMTSRCVNLHDHTSTKNAAEMTCSAATTLANGGACFFIDAINPDGTLSAPFYRRLGQVNDTLRPFRQTLAARPHRLVADVAVYFSKPSHVNMALNGKRLDEASDRAMAADLMTFAPPLTEAAGAAAALNRAHIPYRVVTDRTEDFTGLRTIIVNDAAYMAPTETDRLHRFVADGGTLIATGATSLYDLDGRSTGDFTLADVFGVRYTGATTYRVNFLAEHPDQQYILADRPAPLVRAAGAEVLARVAQPHFDPDGPRYASIHSNPPGATTDHAGLTLHRFGRGRCLYLFNSLMALPHDAQQSFAAALFRRYVATDWQLETNAPAVVEITLLSPADGRSLLVCLVNYQHELPNVPVTDIRIACNLPDGFRPTACTAVSDSRLLPFTIEAGRCTVILDRLETVEFLHWSV